MLGLIAESLTYMFPGGRALKLIKGGVNVTNSSNPLILAKNITLTVVDCCSPPPVRLAAHYIGAVRFACCTFEMDCGFGEVIQIQLVCSG